MTRFERTKQILGSRAVTVWLSGLFIIYYLSFAVWSGEAFGHLVHDLTDNILMQVLYLLLVVNLFLRIVRRMKRLWPHKAVFLCRMPLYAGTFLLLISFFLSLNVRKNAWIVIGEGDVMSAPWDRATLRVVKIQSALRKEEIRTDDSLIFSSEPVVTLLDEQGTVHTVGAFPPRLVGADYMHILNFGIGPGVELRDNGAQVTRSEVALRLTPFGSVDTFELPPAAYKFSISILPNREIRKGRERLRQYDLRKPLYNVVITKGDKVIAQGETTDTIPFDRTMSLTFRPPADWVQLDVAYDPILPLFVAGLFVTAAGLVLFPLSFFIAMRGSPDVRK